MSPNRGESLPVAQMLGTVQSPLPPANPGLERMGMGHIGHIYLEARGRFPEAGMAGTSPDARGPNEQNEGAAEDRGCSHVFKFPACCEASRLQACYWLRPDTRGTASAPVAASLVLLCHPVCQAAPFYFESGSHKKHQKYPDGAGSVLHRAEGVGGRAWLNHCTRRKWGRGKKWGSRVPTGDPHLCSWPSILWH